MTEAQIRAGWRQKPCPFNVWLVLNWICRCHHHFADTCWHSLTKKQICWHLLTTADSCWQERFFKYKIYVCADICWHLLTIADICWRLLYLAGSNNATIFLKGSNHTGRSLAGAQILWASNLSPETCLGRTFQAVPFSEIGTHYSSNDKPAKQIRWWQQKIPPLPPHSQRQRSHFAVSSTSRSSRVAQNVSPRNVGVLY